MSKKQSVFAAVSSMSEIFDALQARGEFLGPAIPDGILPWAYLGPAASGRFAHHERPGPPAPPDGGFVQACTDIMTNREVQNRMTQMTAEDALTGLANRRACYLFSRPVPNVEIGTIRCSA